MTCTYSVEHHAQDGSFVVEHGKALQIFEQDQSGAWKIHRFALAIDYGG